MSAYEAAVPTACEAAVPRRYLVNGEGHRVLIGLTREETSEFESLEAFAEGLSSPGAADANLRWAELYEKHDRAWQCWLAKSKIKGANLSFVNYV